MACKKNEADCTSPNKGKQVEEAGGKVTSGRHRETVTRERELFRTGTFLFQIVNGFIQPFEKYTFNRAFEK